jgi:EpsI family protein
LQLEDGDSKMKRSCDSRFKSTKSVALGERMSLLAPTADPPQSLPAARSIRAFAASRMLLAAAGAVLLWVLGRVWMSLPEMNDRFLIPLAAAWLIKRAGPRWRATSAQPAMSGLLLLFLGALLAPPGWFLFVQVGPRVILLWWLVMALALAALGLVITQFGWRRARLVAFPIAFCFLALPTPDRLQSPLQMQLKEYTTAATAAVLPAIGIPAERRGHVLELTSGQLGVVDACSGVRSVTALTAIALFVAYVRGFSIWRSACLVFITMGIVVVSNSVRVIVTGILQETIGAEFAHGWAHEVLGYLVILVGLGLIVGVSSLLARGMRPADVDLTPAQPGPPPRGGSIAFALIALSLGGCIWAERYRVADAGAANLDALPTSIAGWKGQDEPVHAAVADMLKCDQLLHRSYEDALGRRVELYVMFWATPASTAHMHHPDICMPCQGWTIDSSGVRDVTFRDDRPPIPVSVRTYSQKNQHQLVFYWIQAGNQFLPDGKEDASQVSEYDWIRQILSGDAALGRTSRLSVRIDMELHGRSERQEELTAEFSAAIARQIYALCPWALPQ